jgi:hypothetical protein
MQRHALLDGGERLRDDSQLRRPRIHMDRLPHDDRAEVERPVERVDCDGEAVRGASVGTGEVHAPRSDEDRLPPAQSSEPAGHDFVRPQDQLHVRRGARTRSTRLIARPCEPPFYKKTDGRRKAPCSLAQVQPRAE